MSYHLANVDPPGTEPTTGVVTVLLNAGNGTFRHELTFPTMDYATSLCIADVNADGRADLVVGGGTVDLSLGICL